MPACNRRNPSARYRRLLELYGEMHTRGEVIRGIAPEQTFPGASLLPQAHHIRRLVQQTGSRTILDYGSGKGSQYRPMRLREEMSGPGDNTWENIQAYWGVERIQCYDPGFAPFSRLPEERFDGVISTDVLEHCSEADLPWIVEELFSLARHFVFASVACHPAKKRLPNGENAHCTVRPPEFWDEMFRGRASTLWEVRAYTKGQEGDVRLGNAAGAELARVGVA